MSESNFETLRRFLMNNNRSENNSSSQQRNNRVRNNNKKASRRLPASAVCIMEMFYNENSMLPYPDRNEVLAMASRGGLTQVQVRGWFANKRTRSKNANRGLPSEMFRNWLRLYGQRLGANGERETGRDKSTSVIQQIFDRTQNSNRPGNLSVDNAIELASLDSNPPELHTRESLYHRDAQSQCSPCSTIDFDALIQTSDESDMLDELMDIEQTRQSIWSDNNRSLHTTYANPTNNRDQTFYASQPNEMQASPINVYPSSNMDQTFYVRQPDGMQVSPINVNSTNSRDQTFYVRQPDEMQVNPINVYSTNNRDQTFYVRQPDEMQVSPINVNSTNSRDQTFYVRQPDEIQVNPINVNSTNNRDQTFYVSQPDGMQVSPINVNSTNGRDQTFYVRQPDEMQVSPINVNSTNGRHQTFYVRQPDEMQVSPINVNSTNSRDRTLYVRQPDEMQVNPINVNPTNNRDQTFYVRQPDEMQVSPINVNSTNSRDRTFYVRQPDEMQVSPINVNSTNNQEKTFYVRQPDEMQVSPINVNSTNNQEQTFYVRQPDERQVSPINLNSTNNRDQTLYVRQPDEMQVISDSMYDNFLAGLDDHNQYSTNQQFPAFMYPFQTYLADNTTSNPGLEFQSSYFIGDNTSTTPELTNLKQTGENQQRTALELADNLLKYNTTADAPVSHAAASHVSKNSYADIETTCSSSGYACENTFMYENSALVYPSMSTTDIMPTAYSNNGIPICHGENVPTAYSIIAKPSVMPVQPSSAITYSPSFAAWQKFQDQPVTSNVQSIPSGDGAMAWYHSHDIAS